MNTSIWRNEQEKGKDLRAWQSSWNSRTPKEEWRKQDRWYLSEAGVWYGETTGETLMGKSFLSGNRMGFLFLRGKKQTNKQTMTYWRGCQWCWTGNAVSHFEDSKVHQVKKTGNRLEGIKKNLRAECLPTSCKSQEEREDRALAKWNVAGDWSDVRSNSKCGNQCYHKPM